MPNTYDSNSKYLPTILTPKELQEIISNENFEAQLYQNIKLFHLHGGPNSAIAVKSVRADDYNFWGSCFMSLTEKEQLAKGFLSADIRKPLRVPNDPSAIFKVDRRGVITTDKHEYTPEQKDGFSKKQSVSLIHLDENPEKNFLSPVFGWNKDRAEELVGLMFFSDNLLSDPNLLPSMIMQYDGGTYGRTNRFKDLEKAQQYATEQIFNYNSNKSGYIFASPEELFMHGRMQDYNETLMRMRWACNDPRCQLGIFSDNLKSRLIAQFRAVDMKINLGTNFIPISFYQPDTEDKVFGYMLTEQQKDLEKALHAKDPQLKAMAQVVAIYNNKLESSSISSNEKVNILLLMQGDTLTSITKEKLLYQIFGISLDNLELSVQEKAYFIEYLISNQQVLSQIENNQKFTLQNIDVNILLLGAFIKAGSSIDKISPLLANVNNDSLNYEYSQGNTLLTLAVDKGDIEVVNQLVAKNGVDVNKSTDDGFTALMLAIKNRNIEIVKLLLTVKSIDINNSAIGVSPLMLAANNGDIEIVNELLKKPEININNSIDNGFTALMLATKKGYNEVVKKLLADNRIDINIKNNSGRTAFEIAVEQGHASVVELLLEKTNNQQLNNALILAVQKGHINIVEILLEKMTQTFDFAARIKIYNEALLFAALNGHVDIVKLLIEKGANNFEDALTVAVKKQQMQVVNFLLNTENFNNGFLEEIINILLKTSSEQDANTILYLAAKKGHIGIVNLLLNSTQTKIDVNSKNGKGETALMWASLEGHIDIVRALLAQQNIDPNIRSNNKKHSALSLAVMAGREDVVQALLPKATLAILEDAYKYAKKKKYCKKIIFRLIKKSIIDLQQSQPISLNTTTSDSTLPILSDNPIASKPEKQVTRKPPADSLLPAAGPQPGLLPLLKAPSGKVPGRGSNR